MKPFSERLKMARAIAGITSQKELSELSGISRYAIRQMEAGKRHPSSGELLKIADVCELQSEFFTREIDVKLR